MFKIFGLVIGTKREWQLAEARSLAAGRKQAADLARRGLTALRNLTHNLPFHLNFETEDEAGFCYDVLSRSWDLLLDQEWWRPFDISPELKAKYLGKCPIISGRHLTEEDFALAAKGDINAALYITQVIFSENRERYARVKEWFDDVPGFLAEVSGISREEVVATFSPERGVSSAS